MCRPPFAYEPEVRAERGTEATVPHADATTLHLDSRGAHAIVDLTHGGRLSSFVVDGRELLVTDGDGPFYWGSFPMAPFAGRVRDGRFSFAGRRYQLAIGMPPHAIHGTVVDRAWRRVDDGTIATDLGPAWPFAGRVRQWFDLQPGRFSFRLEVHADEPMPASIGWHPWFLRRPLSVGAGAGDEARSVELTLDAGAMYRRDANGITTAERIIPSVGPWDDCFTDLRRPPTLRWPGFLELTVESDCPDWVVYTVPKDAVCVEPQTAPPNALNLGPAIVTPGHPLIAEMTWTWRSMTG
jgi:aldose 1-epimerase